MRYLITPLLCSSVLMAMPGLAIAEAGPRQGPQRPALADPAGFVPSAAPQVAAAPADDAGSEMDDMAEADPRAEAIMAALEDLSGLPSESLGAAIAELLLGFTAVTEPDEFLSVVGMWRSMAAEWSAAVDAESAEIDTEELMRVAERSTWISSGNDAMPVHLYMDLACEPCLEAFTGLRSLSEDGEIDLRVTILPLIEDSTFQLALGLLSEPETAWDRLSAVVDGGFDAADVAVEPSPANEDLQASIEMDYDHFVGTEIRHLPVTGFRRAEGVPHLMLGGMGRDEARQLILGIEAQVEAD